MTWQAAEHPSAVVTWARIFAASMMIIACGQRDRVSGFVAGRAMQPASRPSPQNASGTRPVASAPVDDLDDIIRLWNEGGQDRAILSFLSTDWKRPRLPSGSVFKMTEQAFAVQEPAQQNQIRERAMKASASLRDLCRHILNLEEAKRGPDAGRAAERRYQAVLGCGMFLSSQRSLAVMRATGKALQRAALQKLVSFYETVGDKARRDAARQRLDSLGGR
jgi:hypothetical protein